MMKDKDWHYIRYDTRRILHLLTYMHPIQKHLYIKQIITDTKGEIGSNMVIVEDFNTPLTWVDMSSRQKISKATEILKKEQMSWICYLQDIPWGKKRQNTFFLSAHGMFSRTDHILGHKINLNL